MGLINYKHNALDETSPFAMAQEQVKLSLGELYSTYFNDLFVLKTNVTIGGQPAEIDFSTNGLVLKCRYPPLGFSLNEASAELGALLRKYGVCQVNRVWCEEAPFIQVGALPSTAPAKQSYTAIIETPYVCRLHSPPHTVLRPSSTPKTGWRLIWPPCSLGTCPGRQQCHALSVVRWRQSSSWWLPMTSRRMPGSSVSPVTTAQSVYPS